MRYGLRAEVILSDKLLMTSTEHFDPFRNNQETINIKVEYDSALSGPIIQPIQPIQPIQHQLEESHYAVYFSFVIRCFSAND